MRHDRILYYIDILIASSTKLADLVIFSKAGSKIYGVNLSSIYKFCTQALTDSVRSLLT